MKQSFGSGRGSVYNIIMKSLQSGDKYGYEICQEIEKKTNGHYILKQPSLYSGLKRLEAQKCVESYWGDSEIGGRRHYYRLTEIGKKKLESSKFTWEDERQSFVGDLFKKDEIDENLDEIKQEIDITKQSIEQNDQLNQEILSTFENENKSKDNTEVVLASNIISNNNAKTNQPVKKQTNSFSHKVNDNQFDLFSFVEQKETSAEEKQEEVLEKTVEENLIDENNLDEIDHKEINREPNIEESEQQIDEEENQSNKLQILTDETQIENINQENEQELESKKEQEAIKEDIIQNEEVKDSTSSLPENVETESIETIENVTLPNSVEINEQNDIQNHQEEFELLFSDCRSTSFADSNEDLENSISPSKDLEKSFTFYGADNIINDDAKVEDDFEKRYAEFEKQFNEDKFEDDEKIEQIEKVKNEEQERLEQEKRMSDILSEGFSNIQDDNQQFQSSNVQKQDIQENNNEHITMNNSFADANKTDNDLKNDNSTESFNLKSIFGDLIEDEPSSVIQAQDYSEYNDVNFQKEYIGNIDKNNQINANYNENPNDIPRYDMSDNINFSLKSTNPSSSYENKKFDDYYDNNKISNFDNNSQNIQKQRFEERKNYEVPSNVKEINIRYQRKNFIEEKISGYVAINKLNFSSALICSLLMIIASLIGYFVLKNQLTFDYAQKVMIIVDIIAICIYLSYFYIKYAFDNHKKIKFIENKRKVMKSLIISLLGILVVVILNIFALNFDINKIWSFYSSFIIPICIIISFNLFFLVRKVLIKFFN